MYSIPEPTPRHPPVLGAPRLLDQVRARIRYLHYSLRTEDAYVHWIRAYVRFHDRRHPRTLSGPDVERFLNALVNERKVSASTHKQALCALLFLYREVLGENLPWMTQIERPSVRKRIPSVLTVDEVRRVLDQMRGEPALICRLLYGTGMRLMEAMRLRVKDVEFERREILVRDGKGGKDRVTMLPENLVLPLQDQLARVKRLHDADLAAGFGEVWLPDALAVKYPSAGKSWGWQYVFPSPNRSADPRSGAVRRHHVLPESVQKAVKGAAGKAGIVKPCTPHVLRHCCATHMLKRGAGLRHLQALLGHSSLNTTERYTQVEVSELRKVVMRCHPRERRR